LCIFGGLPGGKWWKWRKSLGFVIGHLSFAAGGRRRWSLANSRGQFSVVRNLVPPQVGERRRMADVDAPNTH
jgi:hypothetical protein